MMKPILLFSVLIFLILGINGCSSLPSPLTPSTPPTPDTPTPPKPDKPVTPVKKTIKPISKVSLCGYRNIRGVAVVQKVQSAETLFGFYPGDWRVAMSTTERISALGNRTLTVGDEMKAELQEPISGNCKTIQLHFIPE